MGNQYQNVVLAVFVGIFIQLWALTTLAITRDEVIANAERYATHKWRVLRGNANATFNRFKTGQVVTGLPYNWGGFDSIEQFDKKIKRGRVAGKAFSKKVNGKAVYRKFAGIDCSGFVSRVWSLKEKKGTAHFHNDKKSSLYPKIGWKNLKAGDIVNKRVKIRGKWNGHVRLFHKRTPDGLLLFYESTTSTPHKGVVHRTISRENYYIPRRYKNIKEDSISPPTTTPTVATPSISVTTNTPVITEIRPNRLKALSSGQRQWIKIYGKHFTPHSKLELKMLGVTKFSDRVPIFISAQELRYKINVGSNANDWTIKVLNGKKRSKSSAFKVVTGPLIPGKYSEASIRYLKSSDLRGQSAWDLKVMRNEIFARYGYIFNTPKLKDYFKKQAWYEPKSRHVTRELTNIERANIKFIRQREASIAAIRDKSKAYPIVIIAWLSEIGYLNPLEASNPEKVKKGLKAFQRDARLPQTGQLDDKIWDKLSRIKLTGKIKRQLHSLIQRKWRSFPRTCDPDFIWIAVSLADIGYFIQRLDAMNMSNVKAALKAFQRDAGIPQTGQLDKTTWEKFSRLRLSTNMRKQIDVLRCR